MHYTTCACIECMYVRVGPYCTTYILRTPLLRAMPLAGLPLFVVDPIKYYAPAKVNFGYIEEVCSGGV